MEKIQLNEIYNIDKFSELGNRIWNGLSEATTKQDIDKARNITDILNQFKGLKQLLESAEVLYEKIESELAVILGEGDEQRQVEIRITEGAIKQSYLTLNEVIKRGLGPTDEREILVKSIIGEVETSVLQTHKRLRERSYVRKFFEAVGINTGDKILWREIEKDKVYEICKV